PLAQRQVGQLGPQEGGGDGDRLHRPSRMKAHAPIEGLTMDRGLYIAPSGMLAEQTRQDQIANDLANASTSGYKADRTVTRSFGSLLLDNSRTGASIGSQWTAVPVTGGDPDRTPA